MARKLSDLSPMSLGEYAQSRLPSALGSDREWVARAILNALGFREEASLSQSRDSGIANVYLDQFTKAFEAKDGGLAVALVVVLDVLAINAINRLGMKGKEKDPAALAEAFLPLRAFAHECRARKADLNAAFVQAIPQRQNADPYYVQWFARRMRWCDAIASDALIDPVAVSAFGALEDWWDFQRSYAGRQDHLTDPRSLPFWLDVEGPSTVAALTEGMDTVALDAFLLRARGIAYALAVWKCPDETGHLEVLHPEFFAEKGEGLALVAQLIFRMATVRLLECDEPPPKLMHVWMRFLWMAVDQSSAWIEASELEHLRRVTADEIGRLRPLLRRAGDPDTKAEFARIEPHFRSCLFVLFNIGSPWKAVKPLLLAFRALAAPAVSPDLRYWIDQKPDDPPTPWEAIPRSMTNMVHHFVGRWDRQDPELKQFRTEFADWCLERLKTRERRPQSGTIRNEDLVEPDPAWREGCIYAISALCINPGGRGHHILNWSAKHDPEKAVRDAAKQAYVELRHEPRIPKGYSHRRVIFDAFLWLRHSHMKSLKQPIDENGMRRTRELEASRTTEALPN